MALPIICNDRVMNEISAMTSTALQRIITTPNCTLQLSRALPTTRSEKPTENTGQIILILNR